MGPAGRLSDFPTAGPAPKLVGAGRSGRTTDGGLTLMATHEPGRVAAAGPVAGPLLGLPAVLARWLRGRSAAPAAPAPLGEPAPRFRNVCISREAGSGGATLGRLVATRLDWKLYDHEILETIARRMQVPADEVRALDELAPSTIQDWMLPLREEHYAPLEAYLDHLAKLLLAVGREGEAVIVGRGAGFMLPRAETLTVRVVAPIKARAQRLAEQLNVTTRTARRLAIDRDRRRDRFIRTMFHADPTDPHRYDLVIDAHSLGLPIAVELIVRAVEAGRSAVEPKATAPPAFDRPELLG